MVWEVDIPMTFYKHFPAQQRPSDITYHTPVKIG